MKSMIASAALLAVLAGCNAGNSQPAVAPATQASASAQPVNKYCPVESDQKVDPKVTYLYQGKLIGFCDEDCLEKFKKDPDKYMQNLK